MKIKGANLNALKVIRHTSDPLIGKYLTAKCVRSKVLPGHYGGGVDTSQDVTLKGGRDAGNKFPGHGALGTTAEGSVAYYFLMPAFGLASVFLLHHDYLVLIRVPVLFRDRALALDR